MSKYTYINQRRRRVDYKRIMVVVLGLSLIVTTTFVVRSYMLTNNIKEAEIANQETQQTIDATQKTIEELEAKNTEQTKDIDSLKELLWRYEPVIIPDSMK